MRIRRSLRDLHFERESLFCDFSSQSLFHRLELLFRQRIAPGAPVGVIFRRTLAPASLSLLANQFKPGF